MFKSLVFPALAMMLAFTATATPARAEAKVGETAPAFSLTDQNGKQVSLADYAGKVVVLEWFNEQCPFVQKHYNGGHMNALAKQYADKGVVWLAINSSHFATNDTNKAAADKFAIARPILNDASGATGKAYGAKATPGMFVIDKTGKVVYTGAIDDKDDKDAESLKGATNYVALALDAVLAGKPVEASHTKAYGCSVKYAE